MVQMTLRLLYKSIQSTQIILWYGIIVIQKPCAIYLPIPLSQHFRWPANRQQALSDVHPKNVVRFSLQTTHEKLKSKPSQPAIIPQVSVHIQYCIGLIIIMDNTIF